MDEPTVAVGLLVVMADLVVPTEPEEVVTVIGVKERVAVCEAVLADTPVGRTK